MSKLWLAILKDEDFTKAVQEYKTGQKIKREGERREAWKQRALGYTFGLLTAAIVLYGVYWIINKLQKTKRRK